MKYCSILLQLQFLVAIYLFCIFDKYAGFVSIGNLKKNKDLS